MKKIGIVVCNYNKRDYIVNCIQSIIEQDISPDLYDIYVVDNASTDDSALILKENFRGKIILIENKENLGGSGGFNTGLTKALEKDYPFLMCVDNDIVMDQTNIRTLLSYMEEHVETGMAGSRVMIMDQPDRIQAMGARLDFEQFTFHDNFRNYRVDEQVPQVVQCDYVPACSMIVRREAIQKIGLIPRETFIYWDDMEWGYLCKQAGYQVVSIKEAVVLHKGNFGSTTTFPKYYTWRNRIAFYMKYVEKEKREQFATAILGELFQMIYGCSYKKEYRMIDTLMFALDDAIHEVHGKATEGKIFDRDKVEHKIDTAMREVSETAVFFNGNYNALQEIQKRLFKINTSMKICLIVEKDKLEQVRYQFPRLQAITEQEYLSIGKKSIQLKMCSHIFEVKQFEEEYMYIDQWCNLITNRADYEYCSQFEKNKDLFIKCRKQVFMNAMTK